MIALAVSNQRADAHDRVVDVLREFVAEGRTDICLRLAHEIVGGRESIKVARLGRLI
jgi:hypothetical protein